MNKKITAFAAGTILLGFTAALFLWPIPAELYNHQDAASVRITDRNGILLQERPLSDEGRSRWVALEDVSPHVITATIAIEDRRFRSHHGVDPLAIYRAVWQAVKNGRIVSGASTITQQLTRKVYKLPRTWWAKPVELLLAVRLEIALSKDEILEQYLNRMPYGNLTAGIEAAAQLYFAKPAAHLSLNEAVYLAGLPQSPTRYNPYRHPRAARTRHNNSLQLLHKRALIDSLQFDTMLRNAVEPLSASYNFRAPHFCDWVLRKLKNDNQLTGGEVRTSLDWEKQKSVELLAKSHVLQLESENVTNAAAIILDNATGQVLAMVGSADYFDEAHSGQVNGCLALRQPGSALKPFTYGLALERGYTASDILPDIETHAVTEGGDFRVFNYDRTFHGPVRLRTALACSYNVTAVRLLEEFGEDLLLKRLHRAGMQSLDKPPVHYGLGLTLGNGEVTLLELTRAFYALANYGKYTPEIIFPYSCDKTKFRQSIFSPPIAYLLTHILADREARAPAFGTSTALDLPFQCAVKTGTSKDFRDNWAVGYTTDYTVGVWVGNFDGQAMRKVSGISGAGPLFRDIMLLLHRHTYPTPFPRPAGIVERKVCARSGEMPNHFCPGTIQELFITGTEPRDTCTVHWLLDADASVATSKIYEVWPPLYQPWAQSVALPSPPTNQVVEVSGNNESDNSLFITFPDNGDIYKIDPVLRREYQTLALEAVVPEVVDSIAWWIDGEKYCEVERPFSVRWQLEKGEHIFVVKT